MTPAYAAGVIESNKPGAERRAQSTTMIVPAIP